MRRLQLAVLTVVAILTMVAAATAADTVRIGLLEGMSGPFADTGDYVFKSLDYAVKKVNAKGGVLGKKLEIVVFDTKSAPAEAALQLQRAAGMGIQYITQGNGSNVTAVLIDGVNKIYQRDPSHPMVLLNHTGTNPEFTNEKASFFHFRFDANTDQKQLAMSRYLANRKDVKKVFLINMDYAQGHNQSRLSKKYLAELRPDIKIVGDDFVPMGKVKDFTPYIAKIKASGADSVLTANWGNDVTLLVKAGAQANANLNWFTLYGGAAGIAQTIGDGGIGRLYQLSEYHPNEGGAVEKEIIKFEKEYKTTFQYYRTWTMINMLARAMEKAKSTDPIKVGKALEGMKHESGIGEVWMRPDDHQIMCPLFVSVLEKAGPGTKLKFEATPGSGYGFKTVATIPAKELILPTTAKLVRPQ